jgi:hypothetical protein
MVTLQRPPDPTVEHAETLARWLDDRFLDPLIGLVLPGVGDLAMSLVGVWVVALAARRRVPLVVLARMLLNLGIDALVGVVPVAGDLFDFAWKANKKNAALLRAHVDQPGRSTARDWLFVGGAAALLVLALALPVAAVGLLVHTLTGGAG